MAVVALAAVACAGCSSGQPAADKPQVARAATRDSATDRRAVAPDAAGPGSSSGDSLDVVRLEKEFKGIEYYFIRLRDDARPCDQRCRDLSLRKLKLLLEYRKRPVPAFMAGYESFPYSIEQLDAGNGYMKLQCTQCENTETLAIWNKSDGRTLIGTVDRGCGPVCSDEVKFYVTNGERMVRVNTDSIMPSVSGATFYVDSTLYKGESTGDPDEIEHDLPQRGTTILVSFPRVDGTSKRLKGNWVELVWSDGVFKLGRFFSK